MILSSSDVVVLLCLLPYVIAPIKLFLTFRKKRISDSDVHSFGLGLSFTLLGTSFIFVNKKSFQSQSQSLLFSQIIHNDLFIPILMVVQIILLVFYITMIFSKKRENSSESNPNQLEKEIE